MATKKTGLSCFDVSNYFLSLVIEDSGDLVSNLKLQKLCYYAQGFNLACNDNKLFSEKIYAWKHGPVIEELYHKYKDFGDRAIPLTEGFDLDVFDEGTKELLDEIWEEYGQYSAWALRNFTHQEDPWKLGCKRMDKRIKEKDMKDYFLTQIQQ